MKSFKILNKVEKKKVKKLDKIVMSSTMDYMLTIGKFHHIPPEAFKSIYTLPENDHLKDGLMVSENKLNYSEELEPFCKQVGYNMTDHAGNMANMAWVYAKKLTETLDGLMMTPAMYFCVRNHVKKERKPLMLWNDMINTNSEWLDAVLHLNQWHVKSRPKIKPDAKWTLTENMTKDGKLHDINSLLISSANRRYGFDSADIIPGSGLPCVVSKKYEDSDYIFQIPTIPMGSEYACRMTRDTVNFGYMPILGFDNTVRYSNQDSGVRICYKV